MKSLLIIAAFFASHLVFAQESTSLKALPTYFDSALVEAKIIFTPPAGMEEIAPIENMQMNYEKAFIDREANFEVRYAIRLHDFNFPQSMFEMTVLNITGGQLPEYTRFDSEAVMQEFGATDGYTVLCEVGEEFGQSYKYCLLVYIFKKDIGDCYMFYMGNDVDVISEQMGPIFHAIRFQK